MDPKLVKMAETSIVRSLPGLIKGKVPHGRLRRQLDRLILFTDLEMRKLSPTHYRNNKTRLQLIFEDFGKVSGWDTKEKHIVTMISFCLAFLEQADWGKDIIKCLNNIVDYFDRDQEVPAATLWAGDIAYAKWHEILVKHLGDETDVQ